MKIYFPITHYNKAYRSHVFPLLKPFLKNESFTDAERIKMYGISEKDFSIVENIEAAEKVILPMSWNYYYKTNQLSLVREFVELVKSKKKDMISFVGGDFGVNTPVHQGCVLRFDGLRSKLPQFHQGLPVFIEDPLQKYFLSKNVFHRSYSKKPVVGFCGQASGNIKTAIKEYLKVCFKNLKSYLRLTKEVPDQLLSTSYLRGMVLAKIRNSTSITDNFIMRTQYRAGVTKSKGVHATTMEFYNNIKNSDYVVCVRGAGNFSVRLYETLAMGRIPVFVNTDCMLPLDNVIEWKKHLVWVEKDELDLLEEKILSFHSNLDEAKLNALFDSNRELWMNRLRLKGFFESLVLN